MEQVRHDSAQVRVRHIKRSATGTTILGVVYAGDWDGLNGRMGFVSGTLERRLYEEGTGTLRLPNSAGPDGVLHRERFACLADPGYLPGDEWLEVYEDNDLVAVWTPTGRQSKRRSELQIAGEDATTLLKRTREGSCGFWCNAPRTLMEFYSRVWRAVVAEGFSTTTFTYSTSNQTTGVWTYKRTQTDSVNYPGYARMSSGGPGATPDLSATGISYQGLPSPAFSLPAWRLECEIVPETVVAGDYIRFGLWDATAADWRWVMDIYYDKVIFDTKTYGSSVSQNLARPLAAGVPLKVAIEGRPNSFIYWSVDGRLAYERGGIASNNDYPRLDGVGLANGSSVRVGSITMRSADGGFLSPRDTGDPATYGARHLPGTPPPGGLWGEYFDDNARTAKYGASGPTNRSLIADPITTRLDTTIDFADSTPPAWRPTGVPTGYFWVRWTGSIYLDFSNYDYGLRVAGGTGTYEGGRFILADYTDASASPTWLNAGTAIGVAPTGSTRRYGPSGWYPIVVIYNHAAPANPGGARLQWTRSDAVGTWTTVPATALSPYGIVRDQIRNESHYDALKNIADTYGYQWTCEPRSLESDEFPGRIQPEARIGRDTEKQLDEPESTDIQADLDLDARADAVQADASGLADQTGVSQLTAEGMDLPAFSEHLYIGQSYESLSDISRPQLLEQRLRTLVTLRSAVWEEVSGRPAGRRELLDSWPLTGTLAEFAWSPGDGIRLNFPTVGIVDAICRQILGVSRDYTPDGMRPPAASFRPRPRSMKSLLRQVRRDALVPQRNYQQQLTHTTGSVGGTGGTDTYSRITLPSDLTRIVAVDLVVLDKSDASAWTAQINFFSAPFAVTTPGRYDVTALMGASPSGYNVATLTGGTGTWTIQLIATVRI